MENRPEVAECMRLACMKSVTTLGFVENEVVLVKDALAAIDAINEAVPDLLFLNIFLVGVSGVNLLTELAMDERLKKTSFEVLTDFPIDVEGLEEYGVVKVLNREKILPSEVTKLVKRFVSDER